MDRKKVLIVCPYPIDTVPGQRFRFEQYLEILAEAGIDITIEPFLSPETFNVLYENGHATRKVAGVMAGMLRRIKLLPRLRRYDSIFLFRESAPLGPPVFEWVMFKLGARVIYDFDDAIFLPNGAAGRWLFKLAKWYPKVEWITRRSAKVTVCNEFLKEWSKRLNENVLVLPTTVGPNYFEHKKVYANGKLPVIGWSGSHSTARYLDIVRPVLVKLQERHDFEFVAICNSDPGFPELKRYRFVKWQSATEVKELLNIDVGLMPVPDGTWEKGKVGLKAIQYSALGVVPVVSSVGSGPEVVQHGRTGLIVDNSENAWCCALEQLLSDRSSWQMMGERAREYVFQRYSVESQAPVYVSLFR